MKAKSIDAIAKKYLIFFIHTAKSILFYFQDNNVML